MLKPTAISQPPVPRTVQASPRPAKDLAARSDGAPAPNGALFQRLLRRLTSAGTLTFGEEGTSPSGLARADFAGPSTVGAGFPPHGFEPRDASQRDREPDREPVREDGDVVDRAPNAIGEGPGAPFMFASAEGAVGARSMSTMATAPVDELFAQLVTRAAVDRRGDGKKGSMRLELGGRLVGRGHVTVHAEGDDVEIEIAAPEGVDADALEARVTGRLATKGVRVTRFDVR